MKLHLCAAAVAVSMLFAGCGGGGGGGGGSSTGGGGTGPTTETPSTPSTVVAGIAAFSAARGNYSIARAATGYIVTDRRSNSMQTVVGANAIRFSDMTINLGIGDKAQALGNTRLNALIELYIAFLSRVPEANTLGTWIDQLQAGTTMTQLADSLYAEAVQTPAVTGYSAAMLNSEFVMAVYKNVFGRHGAAAPTTANVELWSVRIDKGGISRGALMLVMLEAARSGSGDLASATVTQLLDNRIAVANYFAVQQGINYNAADESIARTTAIVAAVTATDISAAQSIVGFADASFNLVTGK